MALKWYGDAVEQKVHDATRKAIDDITSTCVLSAKRKVALDTTLLQGSIEMRPAHMDAKGIVGLWGSFNNKYALFIELGTDPHWPPIDALRPWARRKLGDENLAFPVARSISIHGTKPQPFLRPTADEEYPKLTAKIRTYYGS